jgi:hypothetical protein
MAYVLKYEYRTRIDLPHLPDSKCVDVIVDADYRLFGARGNETRSKLNISVIQTIASIENKL